ncbi:hypothetical protein J1902_18280, partial [Arthrobacter sp. PO-11]|nr:hypothetical protein [Arthrobacter cavernae]
MSANGQDLTARKNALAALGVAPGKAFTGRGLTGANRARPGPRASWPPAGPACTPSLSSEASSLLAPCLGEDAFALLEGVRD